MAELALTDAHGLGDQIEAVRECHHGERMVPGWRARPVLAILHRSIASGEERWMSEETEGVAEVETEDVETGEAAVAVEEVARR